MDVIVSSSFAPAWQHTDVHVISFVAPLDARLADSSPVIFRPWKLPEAHLHLALIHRPNLDKAVDVWLEQP
jgi:hypothetical protein